MTPGSAFALPEQVENVREVHSIKGFRLGLRVKIMNQEVRGKWEEIRARSQK
jgi:hypothetical protein